MGATLTGRPRAAGHLHTSARGGSLADECPRRLLDGHRGLCPGAGSRLVRLGRRTVALGGRAPPGHFPADDREVPSHHARKVIERSPLDPATNLASAFCALTDRRTLCVVSRPEISQHFQKCALILRRMLPRHSPLCVSDHSPLPFPEVRRIAQNRPEIRHAPDTGKARTRPPATLTRRATIAASGLPPRLAGHFGVPGVSPEQPQPQEITINRPQ